MTIRRAKQFFFGTYEGTRLLLGLIRGFNDRQLTYRYRLSAILFINLREVEEPVRTHLGRMTASMENAYTPCKMLSASVLGIVPRLRLRPNTWQQVDQVPVLVSK